MCGFNNNNNNNFSALLFCHQRIYNIHHTLYILKRCCYFCVKKENRMKNQTIRKTIYECVSKIVGVKVFVCFHTFNKRPKIHVYRWFFFRCRGFFFLVFANICTFAKWRGGYNFAGQILNYINVMLARLAVRFLGI